MKLIEPKIERLVQKPGIDGMFEIIDIVAGVSHNRHKTHDDPKKFVDWLIDSEELTPLESGTVYLKIPFDELREMEWNAIYDSLWTGYSDSYNTETRYLTTNYRVLVENLGWEDVDKLLNDYWCEPTIYHIIRYCYRLILSRAIADDFARHRSLSPMMRTSRRKRTDFDVICPQWVKEVKPDTTEDYLWKLLEGCDEMDKTDLMLYHWWYSLNNSKESYLSLTNIGLKAQDARGVLPPDFATEMTLCGFYCIPGQGWTNFFKQRCDAASHQDAQYIAYAIKEDIESQRQ